MKEIITCLSNKQQQQHHQHRMTSAAFSSRLFDPTSPIGSQYSNSRKKRVTFGDGGDGNADYRHTSARVPSSSLSAGSDPSWWAPIAPTAAVSPSPSPSSSLLYSPGLRDQGYNRYGSYGYRQSYQTDLHGPEHTMMMAMGGGFDSPMQTMYVAIIIGVCLTHTHTC